MKVQVFYVPDCPHHPSAVQQLRNVLIAEGVRAEIDEVGVLDIESAEKFRFRGSPTIRINGLDIAGEAHSPLPFALACRLYPETNGAGVPSIEMMQRAVRVARDGEQS